MAERPPGSSVKAMELFCSAKLQPGIGYPILHRLCHRGLVHYRWEDIDPAVEGRPRDCTYALTQLGFAHSAVIAGRPQ
jgi:DNA-binding PadR family transcriptional regulator